ncbi:hypothetical protein ECG_03765 [Echinococcus granulosus]|nr:hypothetical protein ECG_03765 [Echinococcus granulosus]
MSFLPHMYAHTYARASLPSGLQPHLRTHSQMRSSVRRKGNVRPTSAASSAATTSQGEDENAFSNSGGPSTDQSPLYPHGGRSYATFGSQSDERGYLTSSAVTGDEVLFTSPASQFNFVRSWIAQHHHNHNQHHHQNDVNSAHSHQSEVGYQPAGGLQAYPPVGHQFSALIDGSGGGTVSGFSQMPTAAASAARFGMFQASAGGTSTAAPVSSMTGYSGLFPRLARWLIMLKAPKA